MAEKNEISATTEALNSLHHLGGLIAEQAGVVLLTVLNKKIEIKLGAVGAAEPARIQGDFGGQALALKVDFTQGLLGSVKFVFKKPDVAVLADLMMMGDGSAAYEEDHKDAIQELTNQIMGAVTTAITTQYERSIKTTQAMVLDVDPDLASLELGGAMLIQFSLKIPDLADSKFLMVVPGNTLNEINKNLAPDMAAAAEPAATGEDFEKAAGMSGGKESFDFSSVADGAMDLEQLGGGEKPAVQVGGAGPTAFSSTGNPQIDMLLDVNLDVSIELGRTKMSIKRILELSPGSIIELDRMAGEPVDLLVNDKVVAKGEVVVVDENFGIRIVSLVSPEERLKNLR
jgi:flagellar motor switch protein FliN/FliY